MMLDPTYDEMRAALDRVMGDEFDAFDVAEAIYWFAADYHGGQSSNLYAALCASEFRPGPLSHGCETDGLSEMLYDALVIEFSRHEHEWSRASEHDAIERCACGAER